MANCSSRLGFSNVYLWGQGRSSPFFYFPYSTLGSAAMGMVSSSGEG